MDWDRVRQCIIAVGAAGLFAAAVWIWQAQVPSDLPSAQPSAQSDIQLPKDKPALQSAARKISRPPIPANRAKPVGNPGQWLTDTDYPAEAARNLWQGTTGFMLIINASGVVERCAVTSPSGHLLLDEATCEILSRRARFMPGRDEAGRAVTDSFVSRVVWRLPT